MWNPTIVSASFLFLKTQKNWYRMCAVCLQSTGSPGLAQRRLPGGLALEPDTEDGQGVEGSDWHRERYGKHEHIIFR
jgi:hypothetical protein